MSHPLLFLDIDGVMNTTASCLRHRSGEVFEPGAVIALRWLVRRTGTCVVVTSTRRRAGPNAIRRLFHRNGLPEVAVRIIGLTPLLTHHDTDQHREEEIIHWLEERPLRRLTSMVILDDKPLAFPLSSRLVRTDPDVGMDLPLARRAQGVLKKFPIYWRGPPSARDAESEP